MAHETSTRPSICIPPATLCCLARPRGPVGTGPVCDSCVRAHRSSPVPAAALCAAWPSRLLLRAEASHALMRWSMRRRPPWSWRDRSLAVCTGAPPRPCHRCAASLPTTPSIGSVAPVGGWGRVGIHASASTGPRRPRLASGLAFAGVRRVCVSAPGTQERPACRHTGFTGDWRGTSYRALSHGICPSVKIAVAVTVTTRPRLARFLSDSARFTPPLPRAAPCCASRPAHKRPQASLRCWAVRPHRRSRPCGLRGASA